MPKRHLLWRRWWKFHPLILNWMRLDTKVATGATALVVVFSLLSGFLGHASMGGLNHNFVGVTAVMAALSSIVA